jgi:hypothetical protein
MATTPRDKRSEPRALTAAIVTITDEYNDESNCVLEDLSQSGALIHSDVPLRVGAPASLCVATITRSAVVRHCTEDESGFRVGLSFVGDTWPEPIRLPVHWLGNTRNL